VGPAGKGREAAIGTEQRSGDSVSRLASLTHDPQLAAVLPELLGLSGKLNSASSGLGFIYDMLEVLAAWYGLTDAVLVIEDTPVERQVFRLRRAQLAAGSPLPWLSDSLRAPAGFYTQPAIVDPIVGAYVAQLATTALTVDLLRHDASHDPLTGLLNRRSYERALSEAAARLRRYGLPFALVLIDLDNFKVVNDRFGHAAGDEVLRTIGQELRAVLRAGDVAARLGGDEFALIMVNAATDAAAAPLVQRLRSVLGRITPAAGLSFSSGVACFPSEAPDVVTLQRIADRRLYEDKASVG
jgi:diguanylate cyclase (GGDEF)-like protein